jgi:hypothetical protein
MEQNKGKENPNHARDMYTIQLGTSADVDFLSKIIPCFVDEFSLASRSIFGVLGFSLGGHTCLLSLANSPQIAFGISVVGCGDYLKLMESRGLKSLSVDLQTLIKKHDPVENLKDLVEKDILLLVRVTSFILRAEKETILFLLGRIYYLHSD